MLNHRTQRQKYSLDSQLHTVLLISKQLPF